MPPLRCTPPSVVPNAPACQKSSSSIPATRCSCGPSANKVSDHRQNDENVPKSRLEQAPPTHAYPTSAHLSLLRVRNNSPHAPLHPPFDRCSLQSRVSNHPCKRRSEACYRCATPLASMRSHVSKTQTQAHGEGIKFRHCHLSATGSTDHTATRSS